ncbi:hypothetical protein NBO_16g0053 [Nosema bombycis CQ1]|uniref:Uncharacterized protein n=1 Tax=Nosema bombycis (strain CQ1 / CVCC 102059) TaxID=578461 RepID=R0MPH1_NOSB1|nr:hypothetical protein NBO_16g0053 [Nosema bombycis CQ1]|eukprot:EOB14768.1 hypothetical protein NBO_16g0053 [Nosema bombycis CQ1]
MLMKEEYSEDWETIEHEMMHVEDYFSNHKIAFTEKMAKLYFLKNLKDANSNDKIYECLDRSKKQLVEIKKKGVEVRDDIEKISKEIYDTEMAHKNISLEVYEKEYNEMVEELKQLEIDLKNQDEFTEVNNKYQGLCTEVKNKSEQIAYLEKEIAFLAVSELEEEYHKLKEEKSRLESKQKRLSVIQYEKYIEELYFYYSTFISFFNKLIDMEVTSSISGSSIFIKCHNENIDVEIIIKDEGIQDIKILKT